MPHKLLKALPLALVLTLLSRASALAQGDITIKPVTTFTTPQQAVDVLIPAILSFGALACFGYILYGGYKYITAGDSAANAAAGRQTIINACIGLVLLALSYVIWLVVLNLTGLSSTVQEGGWGPH